jgi:7-cyano-7-deazaguanine synthase
MIDYILESFKKFVILKLERYINFISVFKKMGAIILLSGGMDSSVLAYYVRNVIKPGNIILLFFDRLQKALKEEEFCAKEISKKLELHLKKIDLSWYGKLRKDKKSKEINLEDLKDIKKEKERALNSQAPFRNPVFLVSALVLAENLFLETKEKYDIYTGLVCEGRASMKDTTPGFVKKMNELSEEVSLSNPRIIAPFLDFDKDMVIKLGKKLGVPLEFTYSCYNGGGFKVIKEKRLPIHCGVCSACRQRQQGFYWANLKDPSLYRRK